MIVGIDSHKYRHAAALIDERGGLVATISVANSPEGADRLRRWIAGHDAEAATIGVENGVGYASVFCGRGFQQTGSPPTG